MVYIERPTIDVHRLRWLLAIHHLLGPRTIFLEHLLGVNADVCPNIDSNIDVGSEFQSAMMPTIEYMIWIGRDTEFYE